MLLVLVLTRAPQQAQSPHSTSTESSTAGSSATSSGSPTPEPQSAASPNTQPAPHAAGAAYGRCPARTGPSPAPSGRSGSRSPGSSSSSPGVSALRSPRRGSLGARWGRRRRGRRRSTRLASSAMHTRVRPQTMAMRQSSGASHPVPFTREGSSPPSQRRPAQRASTAWEHSARQAAPWTRPAR